MYLQAAAKVQILTAWHLPSRWAPVYRFTSQEISEYWSRKDRDGPISGMWGCPTSRRQVQNHTR